jgi:ectoine hydroxylase-related dioxygenase (phytanoyl-CoA dioxygenase family)
MRFKGGDGREAYTGVQHAAKAGTVCLWHGWTPHQASVNANKRRPASVHHFTLCT